MAVKAETTVAPGRSAFVYPRSLFKLNPHFLIIAPLANDLLAVLVQNALSIFPAIAPFAHITVASAVVVSSLSIGLIVLKIANIFIAVGIGIRSLTTLFTVTPLALVTVAAAIVVSPLAVDNAIAPVADIFSPRPA